MLTELLAAGIAIALSTLLSRRFAKIEVQQTPWKVGPLPIGGIAVALTTLLISLLQSHTIAPIYIWTPIAFLLLGLADDLSAFTPRNKVIGECLAALTLFLLEDPQSAVLDMLWLVFFVNSFNLLDNMDALASGSAILTLVALVLIGACTGLPAVPLCGALVGFLVVNRPPAKLYLGDTGSLYIGCILGLAVRHSVSAQPLVLAFVALPLIDTTFVAIERIRRGVPAWRGGKDHLSHRLVRRGFSVGSAVTILLSLQMLSSLAALLAIQGQKTSANSLAFIVFIITLQGVVLLSRTAAEDGEHRSSERAAGMKHVLRSRGSFAASSSRIHT